MYPLQFNHSEVLLLLVNHGLREQSLDQFVNEFIWLVVVDIRVFEVEANIASALVSQLQLVKRFLL